MGILRIKKDCDWRLWVQHVIFCILILVAGGYGINQFNMIHVTGDEFGYWGNAAYFNGWNWSELMQIQPYYSFGYSLVLWLVLKCNLPMPVSYRFAICINIGFLVLVYIISYQVMKKLFPAISLKIISLMCFVCALYPSFVVYAKTTYCESLLLLLYWLLLWVLMKLEEKGNIALLGIFILLNVSAFLVHQRCLGMMLASLLALFILMYHKNSSKKSILLCVAGGILLLFVGIVVKQVLIDNLWNSGASISINNFEGQVSKLSSLASLKGLINFFYSISGKIFYFLSSSFLVGGVGLWSLFKYCREQFLYENTKQKYCATQFLMLIGFIVNLLIASVFLIYSERKDILIYGRYTETLLGPILLFGMVAVYQNTVRLKEIFSQVFFYLLCALAVSNKMQALSKTELVSLTTVGTYGFLYKIEDTANGILLLCLYTIGIFILLYGIFQSIHKKNRGLICSLLLGSVLWLENGYQIVDKTLFVYHNNYNQYILPIAQTLWADDSLNEKKLYYIVQDIEKSPSDYTDTNVSRLQFCIKENSIGVKQISELMRENLRSDTYYIVLKYSEIYEEFKREMQPEILEETQFLGLFTKKADNKEEEE